MNKYLDWFIHSPIPLHIGYGLTVASITNTMGFHYGVMIVAMMIILDISLIMKVENE